MNKHIAIVGSGYAGLHLALRLQAAGIRSSLFTDKTPDETRASQLQNTTARFPQTIAREHQLGIDYWDEKGLNLGTMKVFVNGEMPISFVGRLENPASFVDSRLYHARLQETYVERGGEVIIKRLNPEDLNELSEKYSLVVIASGAKALTSLFERVEEHSPYTQPQRILSSAYYRGISPSEADFNFIISPGHGEFFQGTSLTFDGSIQQILMEGIPGQSFQPIVDVKYQDNPQAYKEAALEVIRQNAPTLYERIDTKIFDVYRPQDIIQGAITPVVRRAYSTLSNGKTILAVGDAHVLNDPIVGQGANTAVSTAWILADMLIEAQDLNLDFCKDAEEQMWDYSYSPTYWSNAFLMPPPAHMIDLMIAAMQSPALANAFAEGFTNPREQWQRLSHPQRTAEFIQAYAPVH